MSNTSKTPQLTPDGLLIYELPVVGFAVSAAEHNHKVSELQAERDRLRLRNDYLEPLVPVLEAREAKLAKQLLFVEEREKQAREALAAAQKDIDDIALAVGRAGHALCKGQDGWTFMKGSFKALADANKNKQTPIGDNEE